MLYFYKSWVSNFHTIEAERLDLEYGMVLSIKHTPAVHATPSLLTKQTQQQQQRRWWWHDRRQRLNSRAHDIQTDSSSLLQVAFIGSIESLHPFNKVLLSILSNVFCQAFHSNLNKTTNFQLETVRCFWHIIIFFFVWKPQSFPHYNIQWKCVDNCWKFFDPVTNPFTFFTNVFFVASNQPTNKAFILRQSPSWLSWRNFSDRACSFCSFLACQGR